MKTGGSYESAVIGERFGLGYPPTLLARTASLAPIGFTRLRSDGSKPIRAKDVPPENAFSLHVALKHTATDLWIDGQHALRTRASPGDTFLFDLRRNPVSELHETFDILRFYVSQNSLDELSCHEGAKGSVSFVKPPLGLQDPVVHGLAISLLSRVEHPSERSKLFIDHVALAFHAHITEAYGTVRGATEWPRGSLAPWQLRRALDFLLANLADDPSVTAVARECGLSAGYFSRAFRETTGVTPHKWLMRRRVERAQILLTHRDASQAEIAVACGFSDQSHFIRVFTHITGQTPGAWQKTSR